VQVPPYSGPTELLPLFPLGTVLVPGMRLSLHIFEPRYRQLVADLLDGGSNTGPEFGVVALRHGIEVGPADDLHEVGTTALVSDVVPLSDGRCNIAAVGHRRFAIRSVDSTSQPYLQAHVSFLADGENAADAQLVEAVLSALARHTATLAELGIPSEPTEADLDTDPQQVAYVAARQPGLTISDRQNILSAEDLTGRLFAARSILRRENELLRRLHAIPVSASAFSSGRSAAS
jgi:uncharacterized protein